MLIPSVVPQAKAKRIRYRQPKENLKGEVVTVRFDPAEREALEKAARENGKPLSHFVRNAVLASIGKPSIDRLILEECYGFGLKALAFMRELAQGKPLTDECVRTIVRDVDQLKKQRAEERLNGR